MLRRQVSTAAAAAGGEQDFFARLRESGVLVRTRHGTRDPAQLTGYAVALPGDTTRAGDPVLVRRRETRRGPEPAQAAAPLAPARQRGPFHRRGAERGLGARGTGRGPCLSSHPEPARRGRSGRGCDAAWATADTLHAAAAALGSRILRQAADAYDRAARAPYGRIPAPTPAGDGLRRAARLLAAYGYITSDPSFRPLVLIIRLAVLAEAVADLRQSQQHAAQAAGALRAAQQLHAARGIYAAPGAASQRPAQSAAPWRVPDSRAAPPGPGHAVRPGTTATPAPSATQTRAATTTPVNNDLEGESDGHL